MSSSSLSSGSRLTPVETPDNEEDSHDNSPSVSNRRTSSTSSLTSTASSTSSQPKLEKGTTTKPIRVSVKAGAATKRTASLQQRSFVRNVEVGKRTSSDVNNARNLGKRTNIYHNGRENMYKKKDVNNSSRNEKEKEERKSGEDKKEDGKKQEDEKAEREEEEEADKNKDVEEEDEEEEDDDDDYDDDDDGDEEKEGEEEDDDHDDDEEKGEEEDDDEEKEEENDEEKEEKEKENNQNGEEEKSRNKQEQEEQNEEDKYHDNEMDKKQTNGLTANEKKVKSSERVVDYDDDDDDDDDDEEKEGEEEDDDIDDDEEKGEEEDDDEEKEEENDEEKEEKEKENNQNGEEEKSRNKQEQEERVNQEQYAMDLKTDKRKDINCNLKETQEELKEETGNRNEISDTKTSGEAEEERKFFNSDEDVSDKDINGEYVMKLSESDIKNGASKSVNIAKDWNSDITENKDKNLTRTSSPKSLQSTNNESAVPGTPAKGSVTGRALSQEILDDILHKETLENQVSMESPIDIAQRPDYTFAANDNEEPENSVIDDQEKHGRASKNVLSSRTDSQSSLMSKRKVPTEMFKSRNSTEQDKEISTPENISENCKNCDTIKNISLNEDSNGKPSPTSVVENTSQATRERYDIYSSSTETSKQQNSNPSLANNASPYSDIKYDSDLKSSQLANPNVSEVNKVIVAKPQPSLFSFDDSIESSYFAMFEASEDRAGDIDSQKAMDRPVVQNIVNDFQTESQQSSVNINMIKMNDMCKNQNNESIQEDENIDRIQTNNVIETNQAQTEGGDFHNDKSPCALRDSPDGEVIDGKPHNFPYRSNATRSLQNEEITNLADNYGVVAANTASETDMSLTIIETSNDSGEGQDNKILEPGLTEPQSQEMRRDGHTGGESLPLAMDRVDCAQETYDASKSKKLNSSSQTKQPQQFSGSSANVSKSPRKTFFTGIKSKQVLNTFHPVEELRAIDRIRLGPYSQSIRSPKNKATSPNKQTSKISSSRNKKPTQIPDLQVRSSNVKDSSKASTKSKVPPVKTVPTKLAAARAKNPPGQERRRDVKEPLQNKGLKKHKNFSESRESVITSTSVQVGNAEKLFNAEDKNGMKPEPEKENVPVAEKRSEPQQTDIQNKAKQQSSNSLLQEINGKINELPNGKARDKNGNEESFLLATENESLNGGQNESTGIEETLIEEEKKSVPQAALNQIETSVDCSKAEQDASSCQKVEDNLGKSTLKDTGVDQAEAIDAPTRETTASNNQSTTADSSIDANGIVITTASVLPSSSKSAGDDNSTYTALLKNPPADSEKTKSVEKSKPAVTSAPLTFTTVVIEDETSDVDKATSGKAGRLVLNSIQKKIREKTFSASMTSSSSVPGVPTSPSPENSFGSSGTSRAGILRPAVKTTSMSSLTVPLGPSGAIHPSFPDDDNISLTSRLDSNRPSFDSTSRRSVDYRISHAATVVQIGPEVEKSKSMLTRDESYIKSAIPYLPLSLAVTCLVLNVLMPGLGTIVSGVSLLCCGQARPPTKPDQTLTVVCANCMVGLAQLFTITFMLVGWFWAIGWGIHLVSLSVQQRQAMKEQRAKELQALALSAFGSGSPKRTKMFGTG